MGGRLLARVAALVAAVAAGPAWAGSWGGHSFVFHQPAGHPGGWDFHGSAGPARPAGWGRRAFRPLPPVAGVIHERPGMRPYYSAYGHTNTAAGYDGRQPLRGDLRRGGYETGLRGRFRFGPDGRRRFVYGYGRRFGSYGAYPPGGGNAYVPPSTYGYPGGYGAPGVDEGHLGTQAGGGYLSEPPLAATRAEPPLAPSPYGGDDPGGYDLPYAAGPRVIEVRRRVRAGCRCTVQPEGYPTIYRYGVGTAY